MVRKVPDPPPPELPKWITIAKETHALDLPTGILVRYLVYTSAGSAVSVVFVPDLAVSPDGRIVRRA